MFMVHCRLVRPDRSRPTEADAHLVQDAIWAHARPELGLEHLRVRAGPAGLDLIVFLRHDIPGPDPGDTVRDLIAATRQSPALGEWITAVQP